MLALFACTKTNPPAPTPQARDIGAVRFTGTPPRNVLMLSLDTLRRDALPRYGGSAKAPHLERLLAEGIAFDHHRSCSNWTLPSVICALSGNDLLALGLVSEATLSRPEGPPASVTFIDEHLKTLGFRTARLTTNNFLSSRYGVGAPQTWETELRWGADQVSDWGIKTVRALQSKGDPWLVHLHYIDPHTPYLLHDQNPPRSGDPAALNPKRHAQDYDQWATSRQTEVRTEIQRRYLGEIAFMDQHIGRLLKALEQTLADTLVVVWSDHGEQFWEHGQVTHGYDLTHEEADAIALLWSKAITPEASGGLTTHADIAPTVLAAVGLPKPKEWSGVVVGTQPGAHTTALVATGQDSKQSIDVGGHRLIYSWEGTIRLYDLEADPQESQDLSSKDSETTQRLWSLLAPEVARLDALYLGVTPVPPGAAPNPTQQKAPRGWTGDAGHPERMAGDGKTSKRR